MRIRLGYPERSEEMDILDRQQYRHPVETLGQVLTAEELTQAQEAVKAVYVSSSVKQYMVELTRQTREHSDVYLGASPRGSLALYRTSQAYAAMQGRDYVLPDDVKHLVLATLAHRVILGPAARLRDLNAAQVLQEIMSQVPVPGGEVRREA
jgi:MoxR-like ATPase